MKRQILFSFVVSFLLFSAGQAHAVVVGDNLRAPFISLFDRTPWPKYEQFVTPGGTLEIGASNVTETFALGVGGRYHWTLSDQEKFIPYSTTVVPIVPVVTPAFVFTSPDVLDVNRVIVAPFQPAGFSYWDAYTEGGGIASSAGVQYLVQGKGFRVTNGTTGNFVGKFVVRAVNMTTKVVAWAKVYVDGPILTTPNIKENRCEVKDIDGDGNDELIIYRKLRLTATTERQYVDVFNIATGVAKRATMTWVDNR